MDSGRWNGNAVLFGSHNRLSMNLHRQVHAPWLARIGSPYELRNYARPGYAARTQLAAPFWSPTAAPRVRIPPYGFFGLGLAGLTPLPLVRLASRTSSRTASAGDRGAAPTRAPSCS
ncbi:MAG: hypothetical protein ACE5F1_07665 [Planctomycetota bacterium]